MVDWKKGLEDREQKLQAKLKETASSTRWSGSKTRYELESLIDLKSQIGSKDFQKNFQDRELETLLGYIDYVSNDKGFPSENSNQINKTLKALGLSEVALDVVTKKYDFLVSKNRKLGDSMTLSKGYTCVYAAESTEEGTNHLTITLKRDGEVVYPEQTKSAEKPENAAEETKATGSESDKKGELTVEQLKAERDAESQKKADKEEGDTHLQGLNDAFKGLDAKAVAAVLNHAGALAEVVRVLESEAKLKSEVMELEKSILKDKSIDVSKYFKTALTQRTSRMIVGDATGYNNSTETSLDEISQEDVRQEVSDMLQKLDTPIVNPLLAGLAYNSLTQSLLDQLIIQRVEVSDMSEFKTNLQDLGAYLDERLSMHNMIKAIGASAQDPVVEPTEQAVDGEKTEPATAGADAAPENAEDKKVRADKRAAIDEFYSAIDGVESFKAKLDGYEAYKSHISDTTRTFLQSLTSTFDARRASSRVYIAVVASALTAAVAAVATGFVATALYSIAIAGTAYAAQAAFSIASIAKMNRVNFNDVHADAIYADTRFEVAAGVAPILVSLVAPFIAPAKVAAQIGFYFGSVAYRAVASLFASTVVAVGEYQVNRQTTPPYAADDLFTSFAHGKVKTAAVTPVDLEAVKKAVQGFVKLDEVKLKAPPKVDETPASTPEMTDSATGDKTTEQQAETTKLKVEIKPCPEVEDALQLGKKLLGTDKDAKATVDDLTNLIGMRFVDKVGDNYEKFTLLTKLIEQVQKLTRQQLLTRISGEQADDFNSKSQDAFYANQTGVSVQ